MNSQTQSRSAVICGGSIGGLFAAAALQKRGWKVCVLERSAVELAGRGAGIVTHPELISALQQVGADTGRLGVEVMERVAYDRDGRRVRAFDFHQIVTSWDRMYQVLRALIDPEDYLLDAEAASYQDSGGEVVVRLTDGRSLKADLLVGADGFRSAIRRQMLPDVQPEYAGYVVWRTLAAETDLPPDIRDDMFGTFSYFLPNGLQVIGYPIAGPDNDLRAGHLRYNFVWYSRVAPGQLERMRTDAQGRHHPVSIPPPLIRDDVIQAMYNQAERQLSKPLARILAVSERPFFTPIYDHHSPVMAAGRVALAGDAACVARPHVGMGVTKAAQDALALAAAVSDTETTRGLQAYSDVRVPICHRAYETGQWLGRLTFDQDPAENTDGRNHADLDVIMRQTAVVPGTA